MEVSFPCLKSGESVCFHTKTTKTLMVMLKNTRLASHSWKKTFYIEASKEKPNQTNVHGQLSTSMQGITNCSQMWSCWEQCQMWLSISVSLSLDLSPHPFASNWGLLQLCILEVDWWRILVNRTTGRAQRLDRFGNALPLCTNGCLHQLPCNHTKHHQSPP